MASPLTFVVPAVFSDPTQYKRIGAIIWDIASGKIAGHVQELSGWNLLSRLPIPGGNPLGIVTDAVQSGQLVMIQKTLNTVQSLATVGAVASVANIGVSIGGFAMVLAKLKRMDRKLDTALNEIAGLRETVQGLGLQVNALQMSQLKAQFENIALTRHFDSDRRRQTLWSSAIQMAELRHFYGLLLADPEFCSLCTQNMLALADTHERLVAACQGELFAEFLLGGDPQVMARRWELQQEVFRSVAWSSGGQSLKTIPTPEAQEGSGLVGWSREDWSSELTALYDLAALGDRAEGVHLVTSPRERLERVQAFGAIREESIERLGSLPLLAKNLAERGVSTDEYIRALDDQKQTDSVLAVLDARTT